MISTKSSCAKAGSLKNPVSRTTPWRQTILVLLFSGLTCLANAQATTVDSLNMQFHGFVNQGFIKTDENQFFGDSEQGSWEFTDLGIGASSKLTNSLQVSAQALYRRAGKTSPDGVQLDYALIDWSAVNNAEAGLGLRLGRIKNPFGFYNETRDIAASSPSILLPESIYVDALRQLFHTTDGAGLYAYKSWDHALLSFDTAVGEPIVSRASQDVILTVSAPGTLINEQLIASRLILEDHSGRWRAAYSHAEFKADYQPAAVDLAVDGSTRISLNVISLEYNWSDWQWVAEHMRRDITYQGIFSKGFNYTLPSEAYYLQTSYRINQHWQWLLRYDRLYVNIDDKAGTEFTTPSDAYAKDWTTGVRYQPNSQWLFSAEIHQIRGTAWVPKIENPIASEQHSDWLLFTAQMSWRF